MSTLTPFEQKTKPANDCELAGNLAVRDADSDVGERSSPARQPLVRTKYSATLLAILLFFSVNWCFFLYARTAHLSRFDMSARGWSWWAVRSLQENRQHVDLLLVGSSLVQKLIEDGEATYLNQTLDVVTHRNSCHLESLLGAALGHPVHTYSFAVGGLYASDAAQVTDVLLKGDHKPGAIVYGIAPRDLSDNWQSSPSATETYKLMRKIDPEHGNAALGQNGDRGFDFIMSDALSRVLPLFKYRTELAQCAHRQLRQDMVASVERIIPQARDPFDQRTLIAMNFLPDDCEGGAAEPFKLDRKPSAFDNRAFYAFAYRPFRKKMYDVQKLCLEHMMEVCRKRQIRLILVNMPLRPDNLTLMEAGFYEMYRRDLAKMCAGQQVSFIDMNALYKPQFNDFSDLVHLNGQGAVKFLRAMAPHIVRELKDSGEGIGGSAASI